MIRSGFRSKIEAAERRAGAESARSSTDGRAMYHVVNGLADLPVLEARGPVKAFTASSAAES